MIINCKNKTDNIIKRTMKKAPIKVLIRMRPTSNFAHHNMHVDEETGYIYKFIKTYSNPC